MGYKIFLNFSYNFIYNYRSLMNLSLFILITALIFMRNIVAALCGNGIRQVGEQCDDGNMISGDGCSSTCQKQLYYDCNNNTPNICKYDIVISLKLVGINRITFSNQAVLFFEPNYKLDVFNNINFDSIFVTSIPTPNFFSTYYPTTNLIDFTIEYSETLESTIQTFKLMLSSTNKFWYDSQTIGFQMRGTNCQLTYQTNLWMSSIFGYVLTGVTVFTLLVGIASIFYQKWIGLELIQTYQSVFYVLIILESYPYEFSPFFERLRYINLYDDIYQLDFQRFYTLPRQLSALQIQKQFIGNINVSLVIVAAVLLLLIILVIYKILLKNKLISQENINNTKKLDKVNKYVQFAFGQVFMFFVIVLMFKIISCFAVQLSHDRTAYKLIDNEINQTLAIITFSILFTVAIYVLYWYIIIPDSLKEGQLFNNLKFWNMKFFYPVIYLIYQLLFICIVSIYFQKSSTIYGILVLQILYAFMIIYIWPYNTARKINRILHNFTILFNHFIVIFITCLMFRWKEMLKQPLKTSNSLQFQTYVFIIFGLLVFSTILAIIRLCIFNKDVQCVRQQEDDDEESRAFHNYDHQPLKQEINISRNNSINNTLPHTREQINLRNPDSLVTQTHPENATHFLNDSYNNWKKKAEEETNQRNNKKKLRSILRKNKNNYDQLIYNQQDLKMERTLNRATENIKQN